MFLITSGIQSSTWGWASTQLGMNYDVMDAEGYVSGTTLTITSMGSGGNIVLGQYAYFVKADMSSNGTKITAFGTGSGGVGTYTLLTSQATVGSVGSPIKIVIFSLKLNRPDISSTNSTTGDLGYPTLAPNGLLYIPYNITFTGSNLSPTYLTGFVVIEPGNANTKTPSGVNTSFTRTKIYTVDNDSSGNRPVVPENLSVTNRDRTFTKGVLAPNGLIYFIPGRSKTMIVLNPGTGIVGGVPDCTWSLVDFRVDTCNANTGSGGTTPVISAVTLSTPGHAGGVLDKLNADIYLINASNNERTIRIRPRSSTTWTNPNNSSTTSDIFEAGYYNTNGNLLRLVRGVSPISYLGALTNSKPDALVTNTQTTLFKGGVIDPNPSSNIIYLTPSRFNLIAYINPNEWRTFTEVNYNLDNSLNTIDNFPTWTNTPDTATSAGNFKYSGLSIGYDKRIYYAFRTKTQSGNGQATYYQTVAWDVQLDTTSVPFVARKVKNNIPPTFQQVSSISGNLVNGLCAPALLPNKKFLYFGQRPDANNVFLLPTSETAQTVSGANDTINSNSTGIYFRPGQGGDSFGNNSFSPFLGGFGIPSQLMLLTKSTQIGKVIISSRSSLENAIEVMSVKGFFPGVTNFEYDQEVIDRQSIPSDLSTLPTHPYNYYGNWT